jgi:hypothetical protein
VVLVLLTASALGGCAQHWVYSKPGVTPARLDQDLEACRRIADRPYRFALTRSGRIDQDILNRCMEQRGYTPHRDD